MFKLDAAPPYRRKSPLLNRLGLQVVRSVARNIEHSIRGTIVDPRFATPCADLARNGITTIPDFLPKDVFTAVRAEFDRARAGDSHKRIRRSEEHGLSNWGLVVLPNDPAFSATNDAMRANPAVLALVASIVRMSIDWLPQTMSFLSQAMVEGHTVTEDGTSFLHADLHYPTSKAVLYLNDVDESGGPFVYCYGSHRFDLRRLQLEHRMAVEIDKYRADPANYPGDFVVHGAPALTVERARALGLDPRPVVAPANTLIVANHFGFHAHGTFAPGRRRDTLRMSFRYLETPRYRARHLIDIYKRLRPG